MTNGTKFKVFYLFHNARRVMESRKHVSWCKKRHCKYVIMLEFSIKGYSESREGELIDLIEKKRMREWRLGKRNTARQSNPKEAEKIDTETSAELRRKDRLTQGPLSRAIDSFFAYV